MKFYSGTTDEFMSDSVHNRIADLSLATSPLTDKHLYEVQPGADKDRTKEALYSFNGFLANFDLTATLGP
jgi:hypothetical protein